MDEGSTHISIAFKDIFLGQIKLLLFYTDSLIPLLINQIRTYHLQSLQSMEVSFVSRDGSSAKPVFTQQLTDLRATMKKTTSFLDKQPEKNIKEDIRITFKGLALPKIVVNNRIFGTNLANVYGNMPIDTLHELDQCQINNKTRRQQLEFLFQMQRINMSSADTHVKKQKEMTPAQEFMDLTGLSLDKASALLHNCKGNIELAFTTFNCRQQLVEQFRRQHNIPKQQAQNIMQAANYNKNFAQTLFRQYSR